MPALLSNLLTALLLFQAVSGWCCHRPCPSTSSTCGGDHSAAVSHECCHQCETDQPASPEDQPCDGEECLGFCTFVSDDSSQVDTNQGYSFSIILTVHFERPVTAESVVRRLDLDSGLSKAPLRLHLLHQRLLV